LFCLLASPQATTPLSHGNETFDHKEEQATPTSLRLLMRNGSAEDFSFGQNDNFSKQ
jgi:hypothetical protein